jgi:uncharacterized protein YacL
LRILALLTVLVSAADHWTTYLCLRAPVPGWQVAEANPVADWLFQTLGLVPGLLLDTLVTILAVGFLLSTTAIPHTVRAAFLTVVTVWTAFAVVNNVQAMQALGLSALGAA